MRAMAQRHAEAVTGAWTQAGTGGGAPERLLINLGPGHPSGHGMLRLSLTLDGDLITAAEPVIGYVHRGAEKLFEARDYRQIIVLANRHDWLSAYPPEIAAASAAPAGGISPETAARAAFDARELIQAVMEDISGGRMHY